MFKKELTSECKLKYLKRLFGWVESGDRIYIVDNNLDYDIFGDDELRKILQQIKLHRVKFNVIVTNPDYDRRSQFILDELGDWSAVIQIPTSFSFVIIVADGTERLYYESQIENRYFVISEAPKTAERLLNWFYSIQHDVVAARQMYQIIERAQNDLLICDPHLRSAIFEYDGDQKLCRLLQEAITNRRVDVKLLTSTGYDKSTLSIFELLEPEQIGVSVSLDESEAFVVADGEHFHRRRGHGLEIKTEVSFNVPRAANPLMVRFMEIWEASQQPA
jgi:hypothetical protein